MAEWSKAHDSKSCKGATPSRVRIPVPPPFCYASFAEWPVNFYASFAEWPVNFYASFAEWPSFVLKKIDTGYNQPLCIMFIYYEVFRTLK